MTDPNTASLASISSSLTDVVARTAPAIVSVHSHRLRASGFVWKPGLVVTADEALADEGEISVKLGDGTERAATLAGRDHTTDIALLRVDTANISPATFSATIPALGSLAVVVAAERRMAGRETLRTELAMMTALGVVLFIAAVVVATTGTYTDVFA